jgi:hypothetical protein
MDNNDIWKKLMEISGLVGTAWGLSLLASSDCAGSFVIPQEREYVERAPAAAACVLLKRANELIEELEPLMR